MKNSEEVYRGVEHVLDVLVAASASLLAERGITITDLSERQRNYKSPYLCWHYDFESRKPLRSPEVASVKVSLTFPEPSETAAPAEITMRLQSEVFQIGALSRFDRVSESLLPAEELEARGVADIVGEAVDEGYRMIETGVQ